MRTFLIIVCIVASVTSLRTQRTTVTKATKKNHIQTTSQSTSVYVFPHTSADSPKDGKVKEEQVIVRQNWDYLDVVKKKLRRNNDDYIERNYREHSLFI